MTEKRKARLDQALREDDLLTTYPVQVKELADGCAQLTVQMETGCRDLRGQLHRGLLYALADAAAVLAARTERGGLLRTISSTVDYPQQAEQPVKWLLAEGRVTRAGGRTVFCAAQIRDEEERLLCRLDTVMAVAPDTESA